MTATPAAICEKNLFEQHCRKLQSRETEQRACPLSDNHFQIMQSYDFYKTHLNELKQSPADGLEVLKAKITQSHSQQNHDSRQMDRNPL